MDWGFFEDHLVYEDGKWKEAVLLSHDTGVFADAVHRICHRYEHKHADSVPSERIPVLWRLPGGNPVRQHEAGGHQAAFEAGGLYTEPAV